MISTYRSIFGMDRVRSLMFSSRLHGFFRVVLHCSYATGKGFGHVAFAQHGLLGAGTSKPGFRRPTVELIGNGPVLLTFLNFEIVHGISRSCRGAFEPSLQSRR